MVLHSMRRTENNLIVNGVMLDVILLTDSAKNMLLAWYLLFETSQFDLVIWRTLDFISSPFDNVCVKCHGSTALCIFLVLT